MTDQDYIRNHLTFVVSHNDLGARINSRPKIQAHIHSVKGKSDAMNKNATKHSMSLCIFSFNYVSHTFSPQISTWKL